MKGFNNHLVFALVIIIALSAFSVYNFTPTGNVSSRLSYSRIGYLTLTTTPSSASVAIDGKEAGLSPLTRYSLGAGLHMLQVSKDGYKTELSNFEVSSGKITPINVQLKKVSGGLSVDSNPQGARVSLRNVNSDKLVYKGLTPLRLDLEPGQYFISVEKLGYTSFSTKKTIANAEVATLTANLVKLKENFGSLVVESNINGASVYLTNFEKVNPTNSDFIGNTPLRLNKLVAAKYRVIVRSGGYKEYNFVHEVKGGETTTVKASLK